MWPSPWPRSWVWYELAEHGELWQTGQCKNWVFPLRGLWLNSWWNKRVRLLERHRAILLWTDLISDLCWHLAVISRRDWCGGIWWRECLTQRRSRVSEVQPLGGYCALPKSLMLMLSCAIFLKEQLGTVSHVQEKHFPDIACPSLSPLHKLNVAASCPFLTVIILS